MLFNVCSLEMWNSDSNESVLLKTTFVLFFIVLLEGIFVFLYFFIYFFVFAVQIFTFLLSHSYIQ